MGLKTRNSGKRIGKERWSNVRYSEKPARFGQESVTISVTVSVTFERTASPGKQRQKHQNYPELTE